MSDLELFTVLIENCHIGPLKSMVNMNGVSQEFRVQIVTAVTALESAVLELEKQAKADC